MRVLVQVVRAAAPEYDGSPLVGVDEHEADAGMRAELLDEAGVAVVELLERCPPLDPRG